MREIKFRAWDKENKKMAYAYPLWKDQTGCIMAGWENYHCDELGDYQQFTGLHDKNGKPIFEGDILKPGTQVVWKDAGFVVYVKEGLWLSLTEFVSYEVIGNIYENPELLN